MSRKAVLLAIVLLASSPVSAQQWDWKLTPYLWGTGIDGKLTVGPLTGDASLSFSDVVDILRGAGLVRLEATKGRHGVFADIAYFRLKDEEARDTAGGSLELKLDTLLIETAYSYRLNETYALEFGARYYDIETTLRPALLPSATRSNDFADAIFGFRADFELNAQWDMLFRGNVGGGGTEYSAGLQVDFRRRFDNGNTLDVGFRALDIDFEDGAGLTAVGLDLSMAGLTVGYTFDL